MPAPDPTSLAAPRERVEALEAALRPLAAKADEFLAEAPDDEPVLVALPAGVIRHAAALLREGEGRAEG